MSDYVSKCPVCDAPTRVQRDRVEGAVCEEDEVCPDGCYTYEYLYGLTTFVICGREWHTHYTDSVEAFHTGRLERNAWVAECRAEGGSP